MSPTLSAENGKSEYLRALGLSWRRVKVLPTRLDGSQMLTSNSLRLPLTRK